MTMPITYKKKVHIEDRASYISIVLCLNSLRAEKVNETTESGDLYTSTTK